jgi:hypothetical protein
MNVHSIVTMLLVLGTVWGGLIYFLLKASKYEKEKEKVG